MRQVVIRKGKAYVEEVPPLQVRPGRLLVRVAYSLISSGTERSLLEHSRESLIQKVLKQPEKIGKALQTLNSQGIQGVLSKVREVSDVESQAGYSCSGVVIGIGEGITDFRIGDEVACSGAGWANHAEQVEVPRHLVVKVPKGVNLADASSVTLGAIALQGVRRARPELGERIAVIGLGLLGQLTVQLLKATGCVVYGMDVSPPRLELARRLGADWVGHPGEGEITKGLLFQTGQHGVDSTIITAASESDEIVQLAMKITRKKGRVVVVGAVGMNLERSPFYEKEIDFLISCSYGPGRYDSTYEEQGIDYPYSYVRWTENRNMAEYLRLLQEKRVDFSALFAKTYKIEEAAQAYENLQTSSEPPLAVLISYPFDQDDEVINKETAIPRVALKPQEGKIQVALVGVGSFAQSVHLPNLQRLPEVYSLRAVVDFEGFKAKQVAKRYKASYATTSFKDVIEDERVELVMICVRHHLHASMVMEAAKAGKKIFVEKPLALNWDELDKVCAILQDTGVAFTVGFNRRYSPHALRTKNLVADRVNPLMITYRVNAGFLPSNHWINTDEGGGRIIGEACHMFDLFNYFTDSEVESVSVEAIAPTASIPGRDNVSACLKYVDGSVCTLTYFTLGSSDLGKESIEVHWDGKSIVIDDFKELRAYGFGRRETQWKVEGKGHFEELVEFAKRIRGEANISLSLEEARRATETSFQVDEMAKGIQEDLRSLSQRSKVFPESSIYDS